MTPENSHDLFLLTQALERFIKALESCKAKKMRIPFSRTYRRFLAEDLANALIPYQYMLEQGTYKAEDVMCTWANQNAGALLLLSEHQRQGLELEVIEILEDRGFTVEQY